MPYTPLIANDILAWISIRVLFEAVVHTRLGTAVLAAGTVTVTPPDMSGIYNGAQLIVGTGTTVEVIFAKNVTPTNFQADFGFVHTATDPLYGATFPTGQPGNVLFTQQEMLSYLIEAVDDFMLKTRPLYLILSSSFSAGVTAYDAPGDALRIERMSRIDYGVLGTAVPAAGLATITPQSMAGITNGSNLIAGVAGLNVEVVVATNITSTTFDAVFQFVHAANEPLYPAAIRRLWNVSVTDLDNNDPKWAGERGKPGFYYEDELNVGQYGVAPLPSNSYQSFLWYSQRALLLPSFGYGEGAYGAIPYGGVGNITLLNALLIPDPLAYIPYYGMLARVFRKDGEMRDPQKETYCQRRYDVGVEIVTRLLEGIPVDVAPGPVEARSA